VTGSSGAVKRTVLLVALCGIVSHSLGRSTLPVLVPAIQNDLNLSHTQAGLLSSVGFLGYMAGVAVVTTISGRVEPSRLLISGLLVAIAGFMALAWSPTFLVTAGGLLLTGLGGAGIWMSAPVIATGATDPAYRGMVMGLLSSTMGLGIIAASQSTRLVRQVTADEEAWRPVWAGAAIFTIVLLLATLISLGRTETEATEGGISLKLLRTVPRWQPLIVGYMLFGIVVSSFPLFLGVILEENGMSRSHVSNIYSAFGISAVLAAVTLGRLSDHVGRRAVLLGAMGVMFGASLLVLSKAEPWATLAAAAFGGASFAFPVLIVTHLRDYLADRAFSNALGALTLFYGLALMVGPFVAGQVADSGLGLDAVFLMLAGTAVLAASFIWRLPRPTPAP